MSALATVTATAVSLGAIGWLAATDPKRRRAFRQPAMPRRHSRLLWTAVWLPGVLLPFWSGGAGLVIWMGAVSVAGWGVAAISPRRSAAWRQRLAAGWTGAIARLPAAGGAMTGARRWLAGLRRPPRPPREAPTSLEARVHALEAELAALKLQLSQGRDAMADGGGVVVELAGRR